MSYQKAIYRCPLVARTQITLCHADDRAGFVRHPRNPPSNPWCPVLLVSWRGLRGELFRGNIVMEHRRFWRYSEVSFSLSSISLSLSLFFFVLTRINLLLAIQLVNGKFEFVGDFYFSIIFLFFSFWCFGMF